MSFDFFSNVFFDDLKIRLDHLKKCLYWICYNIAHILCSGVLTARHLAPNQGLNWVSCFGRGSLNHWTAREVPCWSLFLMQFYWISFFPQIISFTVTMWYVWINNLIFLERAFLNLCDPIDYSSPGSSVHGILQTRILERVELSKQSHKLWNI